MSVYWPSAKASASMLHAPDAVVVPTGVEPDSNVTTAPFSALPVMVGVSSLVMSSVDEDPLSLLVLRSSAVGAAGETVSITDMCFFHQTALAIPVS